MLSCKVGRTVWCGVMLLVCHSQCYTVSQPTNDESASDRHLLVLSAPSSQSEYYSSVYEDILQFHVGYVKAVMGKDNVVVLVDRQAMERLVCHLPDDVLLLVDEIGDIWLRDMTTVAPYDPVQLRYTKAGQAGDQSQADLMQTIFNRTMISSLDLSVRSQPRFLLDGGNLVDNYEDKLVTTERFLEDNQLTAAQARAVLRTVYPGVTQVAVIPPDDPLLAHADGMVMFVDRDVMAVVNMDYDDTLKNAVWSQLRASFPTTEILQLPAGDDYPEWDPNFSQACGIMVNGVLTSKYLYVPTFGEELNNATLQLIQSRTTRRTVVGVDASRVCKMGGSVRCLTWQQTGENARKIIEAAREDNGPWKCKLSSSAPSNVGGSFGSLTSLCTFAAMLLGGLSC